VRPLWLNDIQGVAFGAQKKTHIEKLPAIEL